MKGTDTYVWVVTYGNHGGLPQTAAFRELKPAGDMYEYYLSRFDYVNIERIPVCNDFIVA